MNTYKQFLTRCASCGNSTSKSYARTHGGLCKSCVQPGFVRRPSNANYNYSEQASCDRLDYASHVAQFDPDRAAEIRAGA